MGPPPSVDEAANTLMTRLGFLLGEKVSEVQAASAQYSMEGQEENQVRGNAGRNVSDQTKIPITEFR